jgi:predicted nuclease of predicted toxin-antitoxin system
MIGILLDNDLNGMLDLLETALLRSGWEELRLLQFVSLYQVGLANNAIDREVWRTAQANGMILLTGNRTKSLNPGMNCRLMSLRLK